MKSKTMILSVLAITCGLGAAFLSSRFLSDGAASKDTVDVLVAKRNLNTGEIIKNPDEMFEMKPMPKDEAPKNLIEDIKQLKGKQMKIMRKKGDIVTTEELIAQDQIGLVANSIPKGFRAVGLQINDEAGAAGFATLPLSHVDIACTIRRNSEKDSKSMIILENVLVLAAGTNDKRDEGGKAQPAGVVTVALSPEDSLKLIAARQMGTLSLMLRPFNETQSANAAPVTFDMVVNKAATGPTEPDPEATTVASNKNNPFANLDLSNIQNASKSGPATADIGPDTKPDTFRMKISQGGKVEVRNFTLDKFGGWDDDEPQQPATPPEASGTVPGTTAAAPLRAGKK